MFETYYNRLKKFVCKVIRNILIKQIFRVALLHDSGKYLLIIRKLKVDSIHYLQQIFCNIRYLDGLIS